MQKIILLNGPPGSGKDEIANYICSNYKYKTVAFKDSAYQMVADYYSIPLNDYLAIYNDRLTKEVPNLLLDNKSPRQAMQYVIQEVKKPLLGRDCLATDTINRVLNDHECNYIISDLGLDEEEIVVHYRLNNKNYNIIEVIRDGHNYNNDTRSKRLIIDHTIINNGTKEELYLQIDKLMEIM